MNHYRSLNHTSWEYKEIGEILGVCHTTICAWYKIYEREGKKGIKAKKMGRKIGSCRTLRPDQEKQLKNMIPYHGKFYVYQH